MAFQAAHFFIHQLRAALTSDYEQAKDRVAVQLRNALCAANAGAFQQQLNSQQRFIFGDRHAAKQTRAAFGVGFPALSAAETTKAVALFPELHALKVAGCAIHKATVQQALAVVNKEIRQI